MSDELDAMQLEGMTAFAEAIAKQFTDDPNQQALIVEGMRASMLNRHQHPANVDRLFDERTAPQRFYAEQKSDCVRVWDFNILLNMASLCAEWVTDGTIRIPNFREVNQPPTIIPSNIVQKYAEYLALACPSALPELRSANAETLKLRDSDERSAKT